jgi:HJR/Mrr/RecB family endonuclease
MKVDIELVDVDNMSGLDFEKYVGKLLSKQGYTNIKFTEKYDLGVDIIATKNDIIWGIQVKRYNG